MSDLGTKVSNVRSDTKEKNEKIGILAIRIASSSTHIARGWHRGFRQILQPNTFKNQKSALRSSIRFANPEVMHRPRSDSPLHFDISNIWQICTAKCNVSARRLLATVMPDRWPQVCHVKMTFEFILHNWSVSTRTNSMNCFVNWIPASTHVRSNKPNPSL